MQIKNKEDSVAQNSLHMASEFEKVAPPPKKKKPERKRPLYTAAFIISISNFTNVWTEPTFINHYRFMLLLVSLYVDSSR